MSWVFALFARLALLVVWLSTTLVQRAFHGGWLLPLLGILLLPITTLTYVIVYALAGGVTGWAWLWIALAFLLDLAANSFPARSATRARTTPGIGGTCSLRQRIKAETPPITNLPMNGPGLVRLGITGSLSATASPKAATGGSHWVNNCIPSRLLSLVQPSKANELIERIPVTNPSAEVCEYTFSAR